MACGNEITREPILGGLDSRNHRGTGRPQDFELLLNLDGSIEEGYQRGMGWSKYNPSDCATYINSDLHDQMWAASSVVDITPVAVPLAGPPPASPWHNWVIMVKTNRMALRTGHMYLRVSYESAAGDGQADFTYPVIMADEQFMQLHLPGDANDIKVIRLIGVITSDLTESPVTVPDGTGVIVETPEVACVDYLPFERSEISLLKSVTSSSKKRKLFAATRETIYTNDDLAGNWRVIADGLGDDCGIEDHDTSISFKMVTMGDIAVFTNGFDPVIAYKFGDLPAGANYWSADYILDLQALRITSARVIGKYDGFVLIGDVVADAQTLSSRIYWSDYNAPLSWVPGGESAAGFHDFGRGEIVLAIEPLGGLLRVYTSKAVYDGQVVEDDRIFAFEEVHRQEDSADIMRYPNTLVNTGDAHYYLGADSIFSSTIWDRAPKRVEWMHVASGITFRGILPVVVEGLPEDVVSYGPIDKRRCRLPVGGYDTVREAVWFSWPTMSVDGEAYVGPNNLSLVMWPRYSKASVVNQGFTAFSNHRPDHMITMRDWIDYFGICDSANLLLPKEGEACDQGFQLKDDIEFLFNEDETASKPMDPNSAIAQMCGFCLADLCDECDADVKFLMAVTGDDISIKELEGGACGTREKIVQRMAAPFPSTSVGCYTIEGFTSLMQARLFRFASTLDKLITGLSLNVSSPTQDSSAVFHAAIGVTDCADTTRWAEADPATSCDSDTYEVPTQYEAGSRHTESLYFPFYERGEFATFRVWVEGQGNCFKASAYTLWVEKDKC